jgi:DNA-binding NtrC family response regulator
MSTLTILQLSDSFSAAWPALASEHGWSLRILERGDTAASDIPDIVAAGGDERELPIVLRELGPAASDVAAVGALASHRVAVAAVRAGAGEYFALPGDLDLLRAWLRERAERDSTRAHRKRFAESERGRYSFAGIQGTSPALLRALARAERVIPHDRVTVLLCGETGTGKELLARAIHYEGPRREAPFVDINCAAIPDQLLESELFGHERGAFTGATAEKRGLFEVANGGSLFLDEIGHLALPLQGKLLRALEERTIRRVGGHRAIPIDVRVIAATHVDLDRAAREGTFRADLYHRLNVVPLDLPPLRNREGDIVALAHTFLAKVAADYHLAVPTLGRDAEWALQRHAWPGNVRELRNAIERALLLAANPAVLTAEDFAFLGPARAVSGDESALPFPAPLRDVVRTAATGMITLCHGNKSEAARRLGISRPRLSRLLHGDAFATDLDSGDSDA